jgi:hypothetical protein
VAFVLVVAIVERCAPVFACLTTIRTCHFLDHAYLGQFAARFSGLVGEFGGPDERRVLPPRHPPRFGCRLNRDASSPATRPEHSGERRLRERDGPDSVPV